jgi:hypothetical protein
MDSVDAERSGSRRRNVFQSLLALVFLLGLSRVVFPPLVESPMSSFDVREGTIGFTFTRRPAADPLRDRQLVQSILQTRPDSRDVGLRSVVDLSGSERTIRGQSRDPGDLSRIRNQSRR